MRYKKLSLLLITVLVISIVSIFISCPEPETTDTSGSKEVTKSKEATKQWHVSNFAGSTTTGFINATGTAAKFDLPRGIAIAPDGNALYVADENNHAIRKITLPAGEVSTIVGSGSQGLINGKGTVAQFRSPQKIAVAKDGTLYVADTFNHRIRKITKEGEVSTIAVVTQPSGIAVAPDGTLYVATVSESRIKKIEYK